MHAVIEYFYLNIIVSSTSASLLLFSTVTYTSEVSSPSSTLTLTTVMTATVGPNTTDTTTTPTKYTQSKNVKCKHLSDSLLQLLCTLYNSVRNINCCGSKHRCRSANHYCFHYNHFICLLSLLCTLFLQSLAKKFENKRYVV